MTSPILKSDFYEVETSGPIATVWLARPDKLNAMNAAAWADLPPIIDALGRSEDIRVVIIAGRGRSFTVGIDLVEMQDVLIESGEGGGSSVADRVAFLGRLKELQTTFSSIADCPKPVIAAVHGYCLGAGVDLITACDIRLASRDAVFSVRETKLAMVADVGTMQRLPRIVDPGRVAEIVFTGRDFDAGEAAEIGLVNHVYDDQRELTERARLLATEIAANSPLAVQGAKAILRANEGRTVAEALDYMALWNTAFLHSGDLVEALRAQAEGRKPQFEGE